MLTRSLLAALALVTVCAAGQAADRAATAGACADDIKKLCAGVEPGDGRIARCLKDNKDRVSAGCRTAAEQRGGGSALKQACSGDVQSHCADVKPGEGRLAKCLKEHADELSDPCKSAIRKSRGKE